MLLTLVVCASVISALGLALSSAGARRRRGPAEEVCGPILLGELPVQA